MCIDKQIHTHLSIRLTLVAYEVTVANGELLVSFEPVLNMVLGST